METFVITDTHFAHDSLSSKYHSRPVNFQTKILDAWHRDVTDDDLIIHLGDVVVGSAVHWQLIIPLLPGRKVLVLGNHDTKSSDWYMANGFDFCCTSFNLQKFGLRIQFSHVPVLSGEFDLNIHGHLHRNGHRDVAVDHRHLLISLEQAGYRPHLLKTVVKDWRKMNL